MRQGNSEIEISCLLPGTNLPASLFSTTENRGLGVHVSVRLFVTDKEVEKRVIRTKPTLPLVKLRKGLSLSPELRHSHFTLQ